MFQNNLLMGAASISAGGITVDNSVRYNDDDSPRLYSCLLYTSPSPRALTTARMTSSA